MIIPMGIRHRRYDRVTLRGLLAEGKVPINYTNRLLNVAKLTQVGVLSKICRKNEKKKKVFSRFPIDIKYLTDIPEYEIWEDSLTYWHKHEVQTIDECQKCKYKYLCGVSCAYKSLSKKGFTHKSYCSDLEMILKGSLEYKFIMGEI